MTVSGFGGDCGKDISRPRLGPVYEAYNVVKKAYRRRSRQYIDSPQLNAYYKFKGLLNSRKMTAFWNTIKRNRTTKVKSALCASDFKEFYSDVMQALPGSSEEHIHDKDIVKSFARESSRNMRLQLVHIDKVNGFISSLTRGKSPGVDGITREHLIIIRDFRGNLLMVGILIYL